MSDLEKQVQAEFAEAQLQISSDDTVDYSYQIDNLNQEDVFNYYQAQGFDREDAESRTEGTDFKEQVRHENIEAGDKFSRYRQSHINDETYTSLHPTGSYLAQPDANRENLGIPSNYSVKESFTATEDTTALVSTTKDIEGWNEPGTIYSGGEKQYYVATEDLDNFQKTNQLNLDEPQTFSDAIDNEDNDPTNNTIESMSSQFTEPGKQPELNPAPIEDSNNSDDSTDDSSRFDEFGMPSHDEDGNSYRDGYFNEINSDDSSDFDELTMPSHYEDGNSFRDVYFDEINSDDSTDDSSFDDLEMPSHDEDGNSYRDGYFNEINSDDSSDDNSFDDLEMPSHDEHGNSYRDGYFAEINSDDSTDDSNPDDGGFEDDV